MKTETTEGNCHPYDISLGSQAAAGIPNRVEGIIRTTAFRPERIGLYAERIHVEQKAVPLVMKGVDREFDVIVIRGSDAFTT